MLEGLARVWKVVALEVGLLVSFVPVGVEEVVEVRLMKRLEVVRVW